MAPKTVTIVLMGESGVGKTTFVNMIAQYLTNESLDEAKRRGLQIFAPCSFRITDSDDREHHIQVGSCPNEVERYGALSTARPQTYTFNVPSKNLVLNIVDTPGLASSGGIEQDTKNLRNTLKYLGEYKHLDAICLLLKPTNPRRTVVFEHVIRHIAKYLQPAIFNNIMFVFTNTRGYSFKPGDTYEALSVVLKNINTPVVLSLKANNTYCTDNEAFRYLAALQNGISFPENDVRAYATSFDRSRTAVMKMLEHIRNNLSPVVMQGALSINESQRVVLRLSKPIVELVFMLENAIADIQEYQRDLKLKSTDVDYLKDNLFKIEHKKIVKESGECIGNHALDANVRAKAYFLPFIGSVKTDVNYSYSNVDKKSYAVDFVQEKVLDRDVLELIKDSKDAEKAVAKTLHEQQQLCQELEQEVNTAVRAIATFYKFLEDANNLPNDDSFVAALESAIKMARVDRKITLASQIENVLQKYIICRDGLRQVSPQEIFDLMNQLVALKHCGPSFRELLNIKFEFNSIEYSIH